MGSPWLFGQYLQNNALISWSDGEVRCLFAVLIKMMNNLFSDNTASQRGAGAMIYLSPDENQITNNTFVGNSSTGTYDPTGSLGGGMYVIADRTEYTNNPSFSKQWQHQR
jgi:parallel beta-helix repeat protein